MTWVHQNAQPAPFDLGDEEVTELLERAQECVEAIEAGTVFGLREQRLEANLGAFMEARDYQTFNNLKVTTDLIMQELHPIVGMA
jgi:hypothetical protein|tara:strand:+ start:303 stop:557 length:255 start_codon:yes stop_codon:yes gene_type:complete